jgi:hypothetical protein
MMIATRPRAIERTTAARTWEAYDISGPERRQSCHQTTYRASPPARSHRQMPIITRSLDQALATPTLEAPETSERWMKGELHLILQVEIGTRE